MLPKRPTSSPRWKSLRPPPHLPDARVYRHRHLHVISDFEAGEWHVSVSSLRLGRDAFSMQGAVEERGALRGGRVRHLWLPALEMAS